MTYDELLDFIENKMSMSHIYQPLLIRSLVDAGGTATIRQLAQAFVVQDESQVVFYEQRIKAMPVKVLSRHGVVNRDGPLIALTTKSLTFEQRVKVRAVCDQRLAEYLSRRGMALWNYRLLADPVPDNLRYRVLAASGGRCTLCGITKEERPLDVDHIVPRSRGGKTVFENLQALCSKCNRTKGNKDTTDFRHDIEPDRVSGCDICALEGSSKVLAENARVFAFRPHPSTESTIVIAPRRHTSDYFSMSQDERVDADDLLRYFRNELKQTISSITGFSVTSETVQVQAEKPTHAAIHLTAQESAA